MLPQIVPINQELITTVLTIPTVRTTTLQDTQVVLGGNPGTAPRPIMKWLYSGDLEGEEFVYAPQTAGL